MRYFNKFLFTTILSAAATLMFAGAQAEPEDDIFVAEFSHPDIMPPPPVAISQEEMVEIHDDMMMVKMPEILEAPSNTGLEKLQHMIAAMLNDSSSASMKPQKFHWLARHVRGGLHHLRRPCHNDVTTLCLKDIEAEMTKVFTNKMSFPHLRIANAAVSCLAKNMDSVSGECKTAVATLGKHGQRGGGRPQHRGGGKGGGKHRGGGKHGKHRGGGKHGKHPRWEVDSMSEEEEGRRPRGNHHVKRHHHRGEDISSSSSSDCGGRGGRYHHRDGGAAHAGFGILFLGLLSYAVFRLAKKCSRPDNVPRITLQMPRFMTRNNNSGNNNGAPAYAPPFVASGRSAVATSDYAPLNNDEEGAYYA